MKTNRAGLELIKACEGCRLTAYPDPATGGEPWTIGYGIIIDIIRARKTRLTPDQGDGK